MTPNSRHAWSTIFRTATTAIICLLLFAILAYATFTMPVITGLSKTVDAHMAESGVTHPTTAVLMNFRGYDTFLELGVLFVAFVASLAVQLKDDAKQNFFPSSVQHALVHTIIPFITLIAIYLLWRGASGPGGAFQAGAIFAAGGVLVLLTDWRFPPALHLGLKITSGLGLLAFISTATFLLLNGNKFLAFPPEYAGYIIVFIETFAMFSIACILIVLFKPSLLRDS